MSLVNGQPSPTTPSYTTNAPQTTGKRKRSHGADDSHTMKIESKNERSEEDRRRFCDFLVDMMEVLKRHDTKPSILNVPIESNVSEEHATKRAKLSSPSATISLASQIKNHAYNNIEEVMKDVDAAVSSLADTRNLSDTARDGMQSTVVLKEEQTEAARLSIFRREMGDLVQREMIRNPRILGVHRAATEISDKEMKGETDIDAKSSVLLPHVNSTSKPVLTLFGMASTPKQLFSSLQQRAKKTSKPSPHSEFELAERVDLSLRETALPNGISVTRLVPIHSMEGENDKDRIATFGETFVPAASVPPLNPPKQSRHTVTRSQSVSWYNPADVVTTQPPNKTREQDFRNQSLSSGHWLSYNVAPSATQLSSPGEKRKQRDRALSIGEPKATVPQEVLLAHQQAKEDALFKSVYSSFAPDHDDAVAIVPHDIKNRFWWKRIGERRYQDLVDSINESDYLEEQEILATEKVDDIDEEQAFRQAVEEWEPEDIPAEFHSSRKNTKDEKKEDKDAERILEEISELLQTLDSYQQVRNLSLAANARTSAGQNPQLTAMSGSPTTPSSAEFDVYTSLKSQLTLMIATLPPYAVAKLNGDHLEALNISTKLQVESINFKGSSTDDVDLAAKIRPQQVTASPAGRPTVPPPMVAPPRGTQYQQGAATPTQRASYVQRPSAPSATYPSQQYSGRPPSNGQYPHNSYTNPQPTPARHSYTAGQYGPQTSQTQYTNGYRQFSNSNGYSSYGQQYPNSQPAASPVPNGASQYQRPSQPGYQQRAQNSSTYSSYGTAPSGRSASPQNPAITYSPQHPQRIAYTPGGGQPQRPPQFYPPQAPSPTTTSVQSSTANTIGGMLGLSAAEQEVLMNRNKLQLQQAQALRQGSGTPQPSNGQLAGQSNGTPVPQQNGITVGQGQ